MNNPVSLVKDPNGTPAVSLAKVREAGHADLAKKADKAGVSLSKRDLAGLRGDVELYVDHSGSMEFAGAQDYSNGNVQTLVERFLGYSFQLDADGKIPVTAFDSRLHRSVIVTQDNYQGVVNRDIWRPREMGRTRLDLVLEDLLKKAKKTTKPIIAGIVTDGNPDRGTERRCTQLVQELAGYPAWIKFLAIRPVDYLDELDDLKVPTKRIVDNVDTKSFDGQDQPPLSVITDLQFADAMSDELDTWIRDATAAGILR